MKWKLLEQTPESIFTAVVWGTLWSLAAKLGTMAWLTERRGVGGVSQVNHFIQSLWGNRVVSVLRCHQQNCSPHVTMSIKLRSVPCHVLLACYGGAWQRCSCLSDLGMTWDQHSSSALCKAAGSYCLRFRELELGSNIQRQNLAQH